MKQLTQHPPEPSFKLKAMSFLIGVFIIFLAAANGIFTYSGAYLYLEEPVYAILFAVAVQFAIAIALLALPYVHGIGKLSLIAVYAAALLLSSLSAYTYIYNSSLPGYNTAQTVDTGLKATLTTRLSDVLAVEQQFLSDAKAKVAETQRLMDEEANSGGRSGLGPGKGANYYAKVDAHDQAITAQTAAQQNFAAMSEQLTRVNQQLATVRDEALRDSLLVEIAKLRALTNADDSRTALTQLLKQDLGQVQNPVEKALATLLTPDDYSISVIVGIIWAAVFDLVALFLGIVRYYRMGMRNSPESLLSPAAFLLSPEQRQALA